MQAQRARSAGRSLLFAAVLAAHALIVALLIRDSDTFRPAAESPVSVSAIVLLPARRRRVHFVSARLRVTLPTSRITAPITLVLPAVHRPIRVTRPVNWAEAARQAVQAVLQPRQRVVIGFPAGAHSRRGLHSRSSGLRSQAPQSYRTEMGEHVARGSGDCYVVSGPPPLDASRLEQQAQMSSVACASRQRGPSPDNLFKDLPVYRRYHTLPARALPPRRPKPRRSPRPG